MKFTAFLLKSISWNVMELRVPILKGKYCNRQSMSNILYNFLLNKTLRANRVSNAFLAFISTNIDTFCCARCLCSVAQMLIKCWSQLRHQSSNSSNFIGLPSLRNITIITCRPHLKLPLHMIKLWKNKQFITPTYKWAAPYNRKTAT